MTDQHSHSALITTDNPALSDLKLSWRTAVFTDEDGIGALGSLYEAGDALVAVARIEKEGTTILGSRVMVGPGLLLTATHVLDEFPRDGDPPVFFTFLPGAARVWLAQDVVTISGESEFDENRKVVSDLSLVSCSLNSAAHEAFPLMLAPMQIALPLIGERLWAFGFRHQKIEDRAALVTPMVSSGLVTAAFPNGRGERMASPCFEVEMDTLGGMSGGAVVNSGGYLVGIVSSSLAGGPSYITLIWEAVRLSVKGTVPKLATREKVNLLHAKALGLVKLKGNVSRNPWGDMTVKLSDEESKLFIDSIPPSAKEDVRKPGLNEDELNAFIDEWGAGMETIASEATINALENLPLSKMKKFLEIANIPARCLESIIDFSVEDFGGVDDLEIIRSEKTGNSHVEIEFLFELSTFIWTVKIREDSYRESADEFREHFINVDAEDDMMTIEVAQRGYFKASVVFDQDQEQFSDILIISSAIRPPH